MWVTLQDITLSGMSPEQEEVHCVIPLMEGPKGIRSTETEKVDGGGGKGLGGTGVRL